MMKRQYLGLGPRHLLVVLVGDRLDVTLPRATLMADETGDSQVTASMANRQFVRTAELD